MIGTISMIAGIPGQDGTNSGCIPAETANDVLLVEESARFIRYRSGMLELIGKAQVELTMDPFEELRIDKVLFLLKPLFIGMCCVIAKAPEIIGIITIGSLEPGYMVLLWKEDGGAEYEDQLFSESIQTQ
jgi:hypothetical protein